MKKMFTVALMAVLCVFMFTGCHKTDPGYVTCKVNMSGSDKGSIEMQPWMFLPISTGRRPTLSLAAMMPSFVRIRMVQEPWIRAWAYLMPSTKLLHWLMRAAVSSVELTFPLDMAIS